jgi:hypothetical protein
MEELKTVDSRWSIGKPALLLLRLNGCKYRLQMIQKVDPLLEKYNKASHLKSATQGCLVKNKCLYQNAFKIYQSLLTNLPMKGIRSNSLFSTRKMKYINAPNKNVANTKLKIVLPIKCMASLCTKNKSTVMTK